MPPRAESLWASFWLALISVQRQLPMFFHSALSSQQAQNHKNLKFHLVVCFLRAGVCGVGFQLLARRQASGDNRQNPRKTTNPKRPLCGESVVTWYPDSRKAKPTTARRKRAPCWAPLAMLHPDARAHKSASVESEGVGLTLTWSCLGKCSTH